MKMDINTPRGTRDFFGQELAFRRWIKETIREQYRRYGFQELDTPVFENYEIFTVKGGAGEEIQDEIYYFRDKSDRQLGLRFDLTVPLARFMATRKDLPLPVRRFHIGKVWRYDRPAKGRYREFEQADADIVGVSSLHADAECVVLTDACLQALGITDASIRLNSRKIAEGIVREAGVAAEQVMDVFRSMDKLDKIGRDEVKRELIEERELSESEVDTILTFLDLSGSNAEILSKLAQSLHSKRGQEGIADMRHVLSLLDVYGIETPVVLDLSFVRGLEYYTGTILELQPPQGKEIGSFGGGGRYDTLIGLYTGKDVSGIGISFGIDRVADILREDYTAERSGVFVATVDTVQEYAIAVVQRLREYAISAELNHLERNVGNQFKYADSKQYKYVCIIGEQEQSEGNVTVKDLVSGSEWTIPFEQLHQIEGDERASR